MKSNNKGSEFERQKCKELSRWLSESARTDLLWRSAMSGGRATVALAKGEKLAAAAGDITAIDRDGQAFIDKFFVELKHYRNLDLHRVPFGYGGRFISFWEKCKQEAKNYKKLPLLIAKQNFLPEILCLDHRGNKLIYERKLKPLCIVPSQKLYVYNYSDFLSTIRAKEILR